MRKDLRCYLCGMGQIRLFLGLNLPVCSKRGSLGSSQPCSLQVQGATWVLVRGVWD